MQRQRRIDIQLYKEVTVEKKRREINLVYGWKLNFWPFFPPLHTERDYLTMLFQKKVIKTKAKVTLMILRRCNSPAVARSCLCTGYSVYRPKLTVKTTSIFIPKHGRQTIYSLYETLIIYLYKLNSALKSHFLLF